MCHCCVEMFLTTASHLKSIQCGMNVHHEEEVPIVSADRQEVANGVVKEDARGVEAVNADVEAAVSVADLQSGRSKRNRLMRARCLQRRLVRWRTRSHLEVWRLSVVGSRCK